jgi:outer membrane cobalamin receptor
LFGNLALSGHYDVTQIKRIEVVRGPGSSVYGGFAELGVVNIITKSAEDVNGIEANSTLSFYNDSYAQRNISLKAARKFDQGAFSIMGFIGQNQLSNQYYYSVYNTKTNLKNNASANPSNLNLSFAYKQLSAKLILDNINMKSRISYDTIESRQLPFNFNSLNAELNYKYKFGSKLNVTPKIQYIRQLPWNNPNAFTAGNLNIRAEKILANLEADYAISRRMNVLAGIENFMQSAYNLEVTKPRLFNSNQSDFIENYTTSAYVQGTFKSDIVNVTVGGRYLYNTMFGDAFSPRLAITKAFEDLHFKLLYSEAFKTPTLMNIGLNPHIKPEKTNVIELECGYKINTAFDLTANLYTIKIKDPIIYQPHNGIDDYVNSNQTGSFGAEVTLHWKKNQWDLNANYAYYNTNGLNKVENYALMNNANAVLAFANHMANLNISYFINEKLSLNNTFSFIGDRFGYQNGSYNIADSSYTALKINSTLQWNVYVNKIDCFIKGLDLGVGVNNILNQDIYFAQPYNGYNAIYPAFNRTIIFKIAYRFVSFDQ